MGTLFGERLRNLRCQRELSQKELADEVGISHTYMSKIETGALPPPSEKNIKKIAEALEASEDELLILARKVPSDLAEVITKDKSIPAILRRTKNLSSSDWKRIDELIEKLRLPIESPRGIVIAEKLESGLLGGGIDLGAVIFGDTAMNAPVYLIEESISADKCRTIFGIPVTIEREGDVFTVSDSIINMYGIGNSEDDAQEDYKQMVKEYFGILAEKEGNLNEHLRNHLEYLREKAGYIKNDMIFKPQRVHYWKIISLKCEEP